MKSREKFPPVSEMVIESIKALKDNPRYQTFVQA